MKLSAKMKAWMEKMKILPHEQYCRVYSVMKPSGNRERQKVQETEANGKSKIFIKKNATKGHKMTKFKKG